MEPIPTPHRVARTLSKGHRRLPYAVAFLIAAIVFSGWKLLTYSSSEPSTQTTSTAPLPIGSGTFDITLDDKGGDPK